MVHKPAKLSTKPSKQDRITTCPPPHNWVKLSIPRALTYQAVEDRLLIREFVVRFMDLLDIPAGRIDELENIAGDEINEESQADDDDDDDDDNSGEKVSVSWVSEVCVRDVVSGILGLLAEETQGEISKVRVAFTIH
jgi:hypothetical protein